jgi:hypothetical protein
MHLVAKIGSIVLDSLMPSATSRCTFHGRDFDSASLFELSILSSALQQSAHYVVERIRGCFVEFLLGGQWCWDRFGFDLRLVISGVTIFNLWWRGWLVWVGRELRLRDQRPSYNMEID